MRLHTQVAGFFRLEVLNRKRQVVRSTETFPNLITDWGLNILATSSQWMLYGHVGSGSATPAVTDTSLDNHVANNGGFSNIISFDGDNIEGPPHYRRGVSVYEFPEGDAAGNLTEVGVGFDNVGNENYLFSRALILDGNGDPTSITVLADEILRVTYELRLYAPEEDTSGTVEILGQTHNWSARPIAVLSDNDWRMEKGGGVSMGSRNGSSTFHFALEGFGGLQDPTVLNPSVTASERPDSASSDSYVDGSLERTYSLFWGTGSGNFDNDIDGFTTDTGPCSYQIYVDPPIPKNSDRELTVSLKHTWGRYGSI